VAGLRVHRPFEWPPYDSGERQKLGRTQPFTNRRNAAALTHRQIQRIRVTNPPSPVYWAPRHGRVTGFVSKTLILKLGPVQPIPFPYSALFR
jgi:hypothetical protein